MSKQVLVIGAQGMLGRPVTRRLVEEGFSVRAMARDPERAKGLLPESVEVVRGDLQSVPDIEQAAHGCDAVYLSVETLRPKGFLPETDGLRNLIRAVSGAPRLIVLSALGVSQMEPRKDAWWHMNVKVLAQRLARESDLPWTIFEPAWFMETLPLFLRGSALTYFGRGDFSSYWIAGDDYARMVVAALEKNEGIGEVIAVQGPKALTLREALEQFAAACEPTPKLRRLPMGLLWFVSRFSANIRGLYNVLKHYQAVREPEPSPEIWRRFAEPTMSVADYADYMRRTGDIPVK